MTDQPQSLMPEEPSQPPQPGMPEEPAQQAPPPEEPGYQPPPPPPPPSYEMPPPPPPPPMAAAEEITDNDRLLSALAYIIPIIVSVIILVSAENKQRPFQRYHAVQALVADIVVWVVVVLLSCALGAVSFFIAGLCGILPWFLLLILLYWAWQAYQGKYFTIPVITDFIRQQKWV